MRPRLWLVLFLVLGYAVSATAASDGLLTRARRDGSVRVLARLRVPQERLAQSGTRKLDAKRRIAIRGSQARVEAALGRTAWRVTRSFDVVPFVALEVDEKALERLVASGDVEAIEEDRLEKPLVEDNIIAVQADQAVADGYDGNGWTVAVLDTGVDRSHELLTGKVVSEACFSANGSCPNGSSVQTGTGAGAPCSYALNSCAHGTHVAGVVAGRGSDVTGVASGANVIAIQVFSRFSGNVCESDVEDPCARTYTSDTIAALEHVYELRDTYRIAAVNMSLGGGQFVSQAGCDVQDAARKAIIDQLRSVGIVTVAAAGNESRDDALAAPGCLSTVVSTGAVTSGDTVAAFSNSASFLDLLAPGVQIVSSIPGNRYASISGTSQAVPHVSGAFAILNQRLGHADIDRTLAALRSTGVPVLDTRNGITKPRIRIFDALETLPGPDGPPSGVQITPDGKRTLISKDVAQERWAITVNADDGTVSGNVFKSDGGEPSFVWCEPLGDDGNPDPYEIELTFACSGADACESQSCPQGSWTFLTNVTLPGSFFLPPPGGTTTGTGGSGSGAGVPNAPSGVQITPDSKHTLINKDVNGERWAITQNPDDGTVTGNVFRPEGGEPVFLWCERIGDNGNPDPANVVINFRCDAADRCASSPCSPSDWTNIGEVSVPGSFFLP